jgi:hypothetical protein
MTSRIVPTNIDGTFPVAGQDNSSQGFRDNFTNIKNNFTFARNEITDLQDNVLLKSALSGSTLDNDLAGTQLTRPQLKAWTQALVNLGSQSGTVTIDFLAGNFHKVVAAGAITINLINWPGTTGSGALGYGSVRVWVVISDYTTQTFTLPSSVNIGVDDISGYDGVNTVRFDRNGNYIFDFSSIDGGTTYFVSDPMRNRSTLRGNTQVTGNITVVDSTVSSRSSVVITGDAAGNILLPQNNGVMMHVTGQEGYPGRVYVDGQGSGNYAAVVGRHYNGNVATPSGLTIGDIIARFGATPYHSTGWPSITTTRVDMVADQTQTSTALGSRLDFYITANNSTSASRQMFINSNGVAHLGGFVDQGYQYSAPSSNFATQISTGKSRMIFDPTTTIATGNVIMPNVAVDGTIISVHSTAQITTFGANSLQSGTVVKPSNTFTLSAGTGVEYFYHAVENTWYKIR